jgi:hypothetical protein
VLGVESRKEKGQIAVCHERNEQGKSNNQEVSEFSHE